MVLFGNTEGKPAIVQAADAELVALAKRIGEQHDQVELHGRATLEHARRAGRAQPRRTGRTNRQRSGDIRAWAKEHGLAVSERGRIPASVLEQYQAAANGR